MTTKKIPKEQFLFLNPKDKKLPTITKNSIKNLLKNIQKSYGDEIEDIIGANAYEMYKNSFWVLLGEKTIHAIEITTSKTSYSYKVR